MGGARIDAVEHEAMEVWREIQRRAKPLDEGHRCTLPCAYTVLVAGAAALVCEQRAKKGAQYLAREPGVPGTAIPERIRQRQNPLAHWESGIIGQILYLLASGASRMHTII